METFHRHETHPRSICPLTGSAGCPAIRRGYLSGRGVASRTGLSARDRALSSHRSYSETPNQHEAVQTSSAGQTPCIVRLTMAGSLNSRFRRVLNSFVDVPCIWVGSSRLARANLKGRCI